MTLLENSHLQYCKRRRNKAFPIDEEDLYLHFIERIKEGVATVLENPGKYWNWFKKKIQALEKPIDFNHC